MNERRHEMPDPEEIAALLAAVSKEIPGLVKGILDTFFSPEAAANVGQAVAAFYNNLREGGIPEEQALVMTKDYLGTLTKWSEALKGMHSGRHRSHED